MSKILILLATLLISLSAFSEPEKAKIDELFAILESYQVDDDVWTNATEETRLANVKYVNKTLLKRFSALVWLKTPSFNRDSDSGDKILFRIEKANEYVTTYPDEFSSAPNPTNAVLAKYKEYILKCTK